MSKEIQMTKSTSVVVLAVFLAGAAGAMAEPQRPNIVFMMADNLGYGELGCYGGGILRGAATPRIDRLASEGLRLLNYNVEPQCTPSRSALMTGRFPMRSGTMRVNRGGALYGLTQWEITLAEMLSQHGYATGHFGKWHLGDIEGRYPTNQGFDEWYGIPNSTSVSSLDVAERIRSGSGAGAAHPRRTQGREDPQRRGLRSGEPPADRHARSRGGQSTS